MPRQPLPASTLLNCIPTAFRPTKPHRPKRRSKFYNALERRHPVYQTPLLLQSTPLAFPTHAPTLSLIPRSCFSTPLPSSSSSPSSSLVSLSPLSSHRTPSSNPRINSQPFPNLQLHNPSQHLLQLHKLPHTLLHQSHVLSVLDLETRLQDVGGRIQGSWVCAGRGAGGEQGLVEADVDCVVA